MKKNKEKRKYFKPVESTQQNLPIIDFVNGMVVTKDEKFVKMIEVKPSPFFLKKTSDQNKVSDEFRAMLKSAPGELHIKCMSIQADLSYQINDVYRNIRIENNESCKKMGQEYINTLEYAQKYGVSRRFFISFPFLGKTKGINSKTIPEIQYSLETDAQRMAGKLDQCGNKTEPFLGEEVNFNLAKTFYMYYNRDRYLSDPFENHVKELYQKYENTIGNDNFYVPTPDYIAPIKMSYEDEKYLVVNGTYYMFLYIPDYGYRKDVVTGWLNRFVSSAQGEGIDVDIFLKQMPKEQVINGIKRSIGHSQVNVAENLETSDSFEDSISTLSSARYLKSGLANGEDFYYMSTFVTVSGRNPEIVSRKAEELIKSAKEADIALKENKYRGEEMFKLLNPAGTWDDNLFSIKKTKRNVLTDGAASVYPFTAFQLIDKNGLYLADDFRGTPAIPDFFNRKRFNNPHLFISGETGAGKTITLMLLALRARVKHMPVFILAPEKQHEFERVVEAIGGQFISIGAGSRQRINIMEIFKKDERGQQMKDLIDGSSSYYDTSYLSEKISTLMDFFQLHVSDISIEEKQLLNEALFKTYERKGITKNNNTLWADKERTRYKKMPIISDLISVLEEEKATLRLARVIKLLTAGPGEHFNGQTNVNVNNDFFVIGLEKNTKDMLGLSIFMAMDYCWSKIKEDRTKNKLLIIDEWWKMAFNPIAADKSLEISKIARAYGCSMVIATQQMSDILAIEGGKYGNAVLNNCATKILMSMKEQDASIVSDMIGLTDAEVERIAGFKAGQGLLVSGDIRIELMFRPSETEKLLTFTDKETLERYAQIKQEENAKERQKAEQKKLRNMAKGRTLEEDDFELV